MVDKKQQQQLLPPSCSKLSKNLQTIMPAVMKCVDHTFPAKRLYQGSTCISNITNSKKLIVGMMKAAVTSDNIKNDEIE